MKQNRYLRRKGRITAILLILALTLTGCAESSPTEPAPTDAKEQTQSTPAPTPTDTPAPEPTQTPVPEEGPSEAESAAFYAALQPHAAELGACRVPDSLVTESFRNDETGRFISIPQIHLDSDYVREKNAFYESFTSWLDQTDSSYVFIKYDYWIYKNVLTLMFWIEDDYTDRRDFACLYIDTGEQVPLEYFYELLQYHTDPSAFFDTIRDGFTKAAEDEMMLGTLSQETGDFILKHIPNINYVEEAYSYYIGQDGELCFYGPTESNAGSGYRRFACPTGVYAEGLVESYSENPVIRACQAIYDTIESYGKEGNVPLYFTENMELEVQLRAGISECLAQMEKTETVLKLEQLGIGAALTLGAAVGAAALVPMLDAASVTAAQASILTARAKSAGMDLLNEVAQNTLRSSITTEEDLILLLYTTSEDPNYSYSQFLDLHRILGRYNLNEERAAQYIDYYYTLKMNQATVAMACKALLDRMPDSKLEASMQAITAIVDPVAGFFLDIFTGGAAAPTMKELTSDAIDDIVTAYINLARDQTMEFYEVVSAQWDNPAVAEWLSQLETLAQARAKALLGIA